jgi:hypothetical protein
MDTILLDKPWFAEILAKPELQDITLRNIYEYFLINNNINRLIPIITSNSDISIRILDWFVTNYAKKHNIMYKLNNSNSDDNLYFNVYLQYKCQLKSYKKKLFDPFCRKQRIFFYYDLNKCVVSTIGQLNFFKWAISCGILDYVEKHIHIITKDMISTTKIVNKESSIKASSITSSDTPDSEKSRRKRHELSINANKTINIQNYEITLTFD